MIDIEKTCEGLDRLYASWLHYKNLLGPTAADISLVLIICLTAIALYEAAPVFFLSLCALFLAFLVCGIFWQSRRPGSDLS